MKSSYMAGCGNSFFVLDASGIALRYQIMKDLYERSDGKMPVDGVLFLGDSDSADIRMVYFDVERGTRNLARSSMCGNGIRCLSIFARDIGYVGGDFKVETDDGIKEVSIKDDMVKVNAGLPKRYKQLSATDGFVLMGVPHYVRLSDGLDIEKTREVGKALRFDPSLDRLKGDSRDGLHFNSARIEENGSISILTREAGVEDVTQACGTGSIASAYVCHRMRSLGFPILVHNMGGDLEIDMNPGGELLMSGPAEYL